MELDGADNKQLRAQPIYKHGGRRVTNNMPEDVFRVHPSLVLVGNSTKAGKRTNVFLRKMRVSRSNHGLNESFRSA